MTDSTILYWALYSHINNFFVKGGTYDNAIKEFDNLDAINFFYNYNLTTKTK